MPMTDENQTRADRFEILAKIHDAQTIESYTEAGPTPVLLSDMLADMHHFCDAHNIDFAEVMERGREHYAEEVHAKSAGQARTSTPPPMDEAWAAHVNGLDRALRFRRLLKIHDVLRETVGGELTPPDAGDHSRREELLLAEILADMGHYSSLYDIPFPELPKNLGRAE